MRRSPVVLSKRLEIRDRNLLRLVLLLELPNKGTNKYGAEDATQDTAKHEECNNRHTKGRKPTLLPRFLRDNRYIGIALSHYAALICVHLFYLLEAGKRQRGNLCGITNSAKL